MSESRVLTNSESSEKKNPPTKERSRKAGIILFVVILIAAGGGVAAYERFVVAGWQSTDDATLSGNQVVVSSDVLGRITRMSVSQGARVSRGQDIALLSDSTAKSEVLQAKLSEEYAAEEKQLAQVRLSAAQSDFSRAEAQVQSHVIPQEQYDHSRVALSEANAQYDIALVQQRIAEAKLSSAQNNLARFSVTSPIDGIVVKRWVSPGEVVQPAQPIYTLYDLANLWVEAYFKETQIHLLEVGQQAAISVDAIPGRTFTGTVERIGKATASQFALIPANNGSGNFTKLTQRIPVRIALDNKTSHRPENGKSVGDARSSSLLLPGMSAEVRVRTAR